LKVENHKVEILLSGCGFLWARTHSEASQSDKLSSNEALIFIAADGVLISLRYSREKSMKSQHSRLLSWPPDEEEVEE
jgi:hypothetical protein